MVDTKGTEQTAFTNVEFTAAQVSLYRYAGVFAASGRPVNELSALQDVLPPADQVPGWAGYKEHGLLYDPTFDCAIVNAVMTPEQQHQVLQRWQDRGESRLQMMVVRTVALDDQLLDAVTGADPDAPKLQASDTKPIPPQQVVILGAGLDCRAWRLPWPPGVEIYEVDTGTSEAFKQRVLGQVPPSAKRRTFLKADLAQAEALAAALQGAGHDTTRPTAWLMEGLIGYLTPDDSLAMFRAIYNLSAPGSFLLATAPPSPQTGQEASASGIKLHHVTFQQPESTRKRIEQGGWTGAKIRSAEELSARYKLPCRQPHIRAYKTLAARTTLLRPQARVKASACTLS